LCSRDVFNPNRSDPPAAESASSEDHGHCRCECRHCWRALAGALAIRSPRGGQLLMALRPYWLGRLRNALRSCATGCRHARIFPFGRWRRSARGALRCGVGSEGLRLFPASPARLLLAGACGLLSACADRPNPGASHEVLVPFSAPWFTWRCPGRPAPDDPASTLGPSYGSMAPMIPRPCGFSPSSG
jgi:hypothetical protein